MATQRNAAQRKFGNIVVDLQAPVIEDAISMDGSDAQEPDVFVTRAFQCMRSGLPAGLWLVSEVCALIDRYLAF